MSRLFHFVAAAMLAAGAVASLAGLAAAAAQTPGAPTLLGADLCQKSLCFVAFF
jgi:hypothetical protein